MDKHEQLDALRRHNATILDKGGLVAEELRDTIKARAAINEAVDAPALDEFDRNFETEAIILRTTRPVLAVREDSAVLEFEDPDDSAIWRTKLTQASAHITSAARAVGRIELQNSRYDWVGTGWLVAEDIIVTNRHVADLFVANGSGGLVFRTELDAPIAAGVDFLQELGRDATRVFEVVQPLFVHPDPGPDVAFLKVARSGGDSSLAAPIRLAQAAQILDEGVATIGYPAYDSRTPEPDLMDRIFADVYNKKRLAPGSVTAVQADCIFHDCSTLGGNSGSVILDLQSGEALGLHFGGRFLQTNRAVPAERVRELLQRVTSGGGNETRPRSPAVGTTTSSVRVQAGGAGQVITIPLTVQITVGPPQTPAAAAGAARRQLSQAPAEDLVDETEAPAADYANREGYDPAFLGDDAEVPLPRVVRGRSQILPIPGLADGADAALHYEHYSVVMHKARRMCFFSAVNIDGNKSRKSARVKWKWDPRIDRKFQIMEECYGDPPRFSRGHMTRREDPGWGTPTVAKRGNEDSMHVTNVTPQMQAFNSPIWLALEDYALGHAREDGMKISVFTGPYFHNDDPEMYGVRVPTAFWKIIAFIHDETGELCATGYEMDQSGSLQPEEEFVFGAFDSRQLGVATQVTIKSIERRSGLTFGPLVDLDPLVNEDEAVEMEGPRAALSRLEQIRFR
jgi:endonuclease G